MSKMWRKSCYLAVEGSPTIIPGEVIRATEIEKKVQLDNLISLHKGNSTKSADMLSDVQSIAMKNGNIFEKLMEVGKVCSLGEITSALFEVGGQYRRNM